MALFAGLAKKNPGTVDWTPYVPKMFTRFLHALSLPVNYKDMQYSKNHALGEWIFLFMHRRKYFGPCRETALNPLKIVHKNKLDFLFYTESFKL